MSVFLSSSKNPRVLVIGDLILDHYVSGKVDRISPEAPVPVVLVNEERFVLGGAGNVAHNLAKLGTDVVLTGPVGKDSGADQFIGLSQSVGVRLALLASEMPTILKTRVISGRQQIVRIDRELPFEAHDDMLQKVKDLLEQSWDSIVLSDYGKGVMTASLAQLVISHCQAKDIPLVVDPKGTQWTKYQNAWIVTPNLSELAAVFGSKIANTNEAVEHAAQIVRSQYGLKFLLVTRSEMGMSLFSETGVAHFPTAKVDVFDVSGAGDTVVAVLAASLGHHLSIELATQWANWAGGYVVSKFGTYAISAAELDALIEANA